MGTNANAKKLSVLLLYADVAALMSECGDELQAMLNVVRSVARMRASMMWYERCGCTKHYV